MNGFSEDLSGDLLGIHRFLDFRRLSVNGFSGDSPIFGFSPFVGEWLFWRFTDISCFANIGEMLTVELGKRPYVVDITSLPILLWLGFSPINLLFEILGEQIFVIFTEKEESANLGDFLCKLVSPPVNITRIFIPFFHR